jgi:glycosyltransferase involved in cell wall biosynthesis
MNGSKSQPKIVAAIPCFNTEDSIGSVVSKAKKYVDRVIVVDDGSQDGTAEAARAAGALVISHGKNLGKGTAMRIAVEGSSDADAIVFLDGDGAHDPQDIPRVITPILEGKTDLVIGSRALRESKVSISPLARRLSNNLASFIISVIISFLLPLATLFKCPVKHIKITDCTSGFRAIKTETWQRLNLVSSGFQIETEMIYEAARNRLTITEAPISCNWNSQLSHLSILKDGLRTVKLLTGKLIGDINGRQKKNEGSYNPWYSPRNNKNVPDYKGAREKEI